LVQEFTPLARPTTYNITMKTISNSIVFIRLVALLALVPGIVLARPVVRSIRSGHGTNFLKLSLAWPNKKSFSLF
jgi:ABC-type Fe3+ transport system permease subunit